MARTKTQLSVTKATQLIEASYKLTLDEQRLVLISISKINPMDTLEKSNRAITITADEYADTFNLARRSAYQQLKVALSKLWDRQIVIHEGGKKTTHRWLPDKIEYPEKDGKVELRFNLSILPYLTNIQANFKSYKLKQLADVRSVYTIRIYELLNQYLDTGWREISVNDFRDTLQVGDKYERYADLRKWVLTPAQEEMAIKTNISFSFTPKKTGRKITALHFKIREQPQQKLIF